MHQTDFFISHICFSKTSYNLNDSIFSYIIGFFFSLSKIFLRPIYAVACIRGLFLLYCSIFCFPVLFLMNNWKTFSFSYSEESCYEFSLCEQILWMLSILISCTIWIVHFYMRTKLGTPVASYSQNIFCDYSC